MSDQDMRQTILVDPLLYVQTVSEILQVHENTVYKLVRSGKLEGYKVGSCVRISRSSLVRYLESIKVSSD